MLRVILRHSVRDQFSGASWVEYQTMDIEIPELEARLRSGGLGDSGYDITQVFAVEVRDTSKPIAQ